MNGFYSLLLTDVGTNDLWRQSDHPQNMSGNNNNFIDLLTDKVSENNMASDLPEQLLTAIHELGEHLALDKELQHHLISLVESLMHDDNLIEAMNELFINDLVDFVGQFFEQKTNIPADVAIQTFLAKLSEYEYFNQSMTGEPLDHLLSSNIENHISFDHSFNRININAKTTINEQVATAKHVHREFFLQMDTIDSDRTLLGHSSAILKLLGQWQQLSEDVRAQVTEHNLSTNKNLTQLWDDLFTRYNKRTNLLNQPAYHHNSKVTAQDVTQWLKHLSPTILKNVQSVQSTQTIAHEVIHSAHQSPIEQYVIYTRISNDNHSVSDELLNQFRQIIKTSQFSPTHPTLNQLSMTLKPNNLGEMLVRFVEFNGEMTVKILVTSQITKSILDKNIHQLKHMFSPHQVSIEKTDDGQNLTSKDETLQEDSEAHQDHEESQKKQEQQLTDEESTDFQQLLNDYI